VSCGDANVLIVLSPDADPKTGKADAAVPLGGKPEFLAADGTGRVYVNVEDKDQVAVVDIKTMSVVGKWSTAPGGAPVGMSMDASKRRRFVGCRNPQKLIVMSADDGKVLANLPIGAGVDATAFDNGNILASCRDGSLTVVRETSSQKYEVVQTVKTRPGARTMGVDTTTHQIFLPTAEFGPQAVTQSRPVPKPDSFMVVVVPRSRR
jgi:outer membrane protein assembly factor BamB